MMYRGWRYRDRGILFGKKRKKGRERPKNELKRGREYKRKDG